MTEERAQRRLSAILAADVVGYSMMMGANEAGTLAALKTVWTGLFNPIVDDHRGRIVKTMGDGVLVEYGSAVDAVECAVAIQLKMQKYNESRPNEMPIEFRIGINIGDIVVDGDDIFGDGVNVAARLEGQAPKNGVLISDSVRAQLSGKSQLTFIEAGELTLKNIAKPVTVWNWKESGSSAKLPSIRSNSRRNIIATIVSLVVLVAGLITWMQFWDSDVERADPSKIAYTLPDKPSVAILPFSNMSGDPNQEFFSDGFTEDIITGLSSFHDLFVIARNSSFKFKGQDVDIRQIATDLGVKYVLEGSVRKTGKKLLINAQLIDAISGAHLWAKRYNVDATELLAVQDEVAQEIVSTLVSKVRSTDTVRAKRKRKSDLTAYEYLLQARDLFRKGGKETSFRAQEMAKKSIQLDPSYAPAHAMLSFTYYKHFVFRWAPPETLLLAQESAQKAIELDNSLAEGYDMLARVYSRQRQHDDSVATLEKAVSLNSNRAETYQSLANTLTFAGRPVEAVNAVQKARRLDPFYGYLGDFYLGRALYFAKQYEEALLPLKTCVARAPKFPACYMYLAPLYAELDRTEDASNTVANLLALLPGFTIEASVQNHLPYIPQTMSHYVQGLRKSGVPER